MQTLLALHFIVFRPGLSCEGRAVRAGIHALLGIMFIILTFWIVAFVLESDWRKVTIEILYLMVFLFMVLTPYFQTADQGIPIVFLKGPTCFRFRNVWFLETS